MTHPCPYKVYLRIRGETKKTMIARFRERVDAVNYAYAHSKGRYAAFPKSIVVYDLDGKIFCKCEQGCLTGGKLYNA